MSKHVIVTGASGYLGSNLIPALQAQGFAVTGVDLLPPKLPINGCRCIQVDLANGDVVRDALSGADVICHVASVHPWKTYSDDFYIDANIKGTWNLYKAVKDLKISKVVMTSSIAGAGYGFKPTDWPVNETQIGHAPDIYTFTKMSQELIARSAAEAHNIQTFALRPPAFMPRETKDAGFGLLGNYCLVGDVVAAHIAAIGVLAGVQPAGGPASNFEAFFTTNALPYQAVDVAERTFQSSVDLPLATRHYPSAGRYLEANGFTGSWLAAVYDLKKAERILNWKPSYNFEQWFAAHGH